MTQPRLALTGCDVFDGHETRSGMALLIGGGSVEAVLPASELSDDVPRQDLGQGIISPGFVDLQVNGGGGVMFNDEQSVEALRRICAAHARYGTTALLPTLITDTPARTRAAIDVAVRAIDEGVAGVAGLHLEGPHLSLARKGAHDPSLIRPMNDEDIALLLEAATRLPALLLTVAPETVTADQIRALSSAGAVVSLGHSDAGHDLVVEAVEAGARCSTHLFNAMSQLGNREPGLVGATLNTGALYAGLIADGFHVHPASIAVALRAKVGPGEIFLVTDAMSTVGTEDTEFTLNGRRILRQGGRLTLEDGTLAGADLDMISAVRYIDRTVGAGLGRALRMATSAPAAVMGLAGHGTLAPGSRADFLHLDRTGDLRGVWQGGNPLQI